MSANNALILPPGYEDLEPFVTDWALPTNMARYTKRVGSNFDQLRQFYDAVQPRADQALKYLDLFPIGELKGPEERLMYLLLALVDVSLAIEVYGVASLPLSPAAERYSVEMRGMTFS